MSIFRFLVFISLAGLVIGCHSPTTDDQSLAEPVESNSERETRVVQLVKQPGPEVEADVVDRTAAAKVIEEVIVTGARPAHPAAMDLAAHVKQRAHYLRMPSAPAYQDYGRDQYQVFQDNRWTWTHDQSVSTFAVDVDTASYANMRRSLEEGLLPPGDAIRVEELVNYFDYDYPAPQGEEPFGIYREIGPSPWASQSKLLHIGINTTPPASVDDLPPANLVFLVDVSGSMQAPNKIHLLKRALKLLTRQLRPQDRIALVVYAGAAGMVLDSTPGSQKGEILAAIDNLQAGGSTNGAAGIHLAYQLAQQHFIANGINRVMLATDGDFNVGTTDTRALEQLVERKRQSGVALTVLGFGSGNLNDHMMQKIAQVGDGNAAYIDTMHEARKVLVDELGATLNIVARDVKIQVEFNPAVVTGYRLIGYETRHLNREDFNNDKVDAGDVGEGHTVTALYEVSLVGDDHPLVDELRYPKLNAEQPTQGPRLSELAHIKVRYKSEHGGRSQLISRVVQRDDVQPSFAQTSQRFRFSSAVAWFGQLLRGSDVVANQDYQQLLDVAGRAKGADNQGYRSELLKLMRTAQALLPTAPPAEEIAKSS